MTTIDYDGTYFNPRDVLECGQLFRYRQYRDGYLLFSGDNACYLHSQKGRTLIETDAPEYFYAYFDLGREYAAVIEKMKSFNLPVLSEAAEKNKGLRIVLQQPEETIFSFILSQNNNIPRIKGIIEKICSALGQKKEICGEEYFTFPKASALAKMPASFYRELGAGYRDRFMADTAARIAKEGIEHLKALPSDELRNSLLTYAGIGPKVADCICLFGFNRAASFPVDTWIEKIYRENFGGELKDRNKINAYFLSLFGEYAGFAQQYLFYAKRSENI